jgi:hypothetical protein
LNLLKRRCKNNGVNRPHGLNKDELLRLEFLEVPVWGKKICGLGKTKLVKNTRLKGINGNKN